jgi:hypothetical protein
LEVKEFIYRATPPNEPRVRPQVVALRRAQDYVTGLSFLAEPLPDRPNLRYRVSTLIAAGFVVRPDAGIAVTPIHSIDPATNGVTLAGVFPADHVSVYLQNAVAWEQWYTDETTAAKQGRVSVQTQALYDLRDGVVP